MFVSKFSSVTTYKSMIYLFAICKDCFCFILLFFSLRCPTRHTSNSLDSSLPPCVSLTLSLPTFLSTVTTSVMALQTSASTSCAVILPEFLALVIQAIQTLIPAIVQQSLSAAVGAPPVTVSIQGLPTTAQSSNYPALANTSIISRWPTCPPLYYVGDTFQASWYKLTQLSFALKVSKRKFLNACYFSNTM